jgi:hypothetical protein
MNEWASDAAPLDRRGAAMSDFKQPKQTRAEKAYVSLQGEDEFSVFSVEAKAQKPPVKLEAQPTGQPEPTPLSRSLGQRLRKIFGR